MPHGPDGRRRPARRWIPGKACIPFLVMAFWGPGLSGQQLALERELPPPPAFEPCTPSDEEARSPSGEDRASAEALVQEAVQAQVLGERERARSLLAGAAALDPSSPSIQFQLGRVLEDLEEPEAALAAYCRYQELASGGTDEADVEAAIERIAPVPEDSIPDAAREAFGAGVERYDAREYDRAAREFSRALVEHPDWALAYFNRAVAYLEEGRLSAVRADLERYLELTPDGEHGAVRSQLARLEAPASRRSPGAAFGLGLLLPGMGHMYSGRAGMGTLYLLAAGGSAAAGLLYSEVEVVCTLGSAVDQCPPEFVAEERETRPLLGAGLAGAGAITLIGAIHSYISTRRGRPPQPSVALEMPVGPLLPAGSANATLSLVPVIDREAAGVEAALRLRF